VFYMGNKYHPCAVLVPLDDEVGREIIRHVVDMGVAVAGFCKTANVGLEKVVCNVLANPNIRWIVVAGHENPGHRSGKAIIMLARYGVDPHTRRIMCRDGPCRDIPTGYLPNIPLYAVERFRRQVTVVDLLVDGKEVTDENVLELTCMAVYGTIQEPKNMIRLVIKNVEYRLFDPGAFDSKPCKITITGKDPIIESVGQDHAFLRVFDLTSLERELKKLIQNNLRRNIVIVYGSYINDDKIIEKRLINNGKLVAILERSESQVVVRGFFVDCVRLSDLISTIVELERCHREGSGGFYVVINVPELYDG